MGHDDFALVGVVQQPPHRPAPERRRRTLGGQVLPGGRTAVRIEPVDKHQPHEELVLALPLRQGRPRGTFGRLRGARRTQDFARRRCRFLAGAFVVRHSEQYTPPS